MARDIYMVTKTAPKMKITRKPKVCVLTGFGINCDYETEHAFTIAGADPERVHLNDLRLKCVSSDNKKT